jgi:hypothetical protein
MADDFATDTETESVDRLMAAGDEIRRKRGRPPGSKNRPKNGDETPAVKVSAASQRKIFAGALVGLFALLGVILAWFGFEKVDDLNEDEADQGATYLLPIAEKIGAIATVAFYMSFPVWFLTKITEKFRKKPDPAQIPPAIGSPAPGNSAASSGQGSSDSPASGQGFSSLDEVRPN